MMPVSMLLSTTTMMTMLLINKSKHQLMKKMGLLSSFMVLWASLFIWFSKQTYEQFQLIWSIELLLNKTNLYWGPMNFGIDNISLLFIMLTNLLMPMCIIMSWNTINFLVKEFVVAMLSMQMLLLMVFTSLNILIFYMFFEGMLIPMFLMMGVWGSSKEKESAAYYFFFFTLAGSLFMLLGLFALYDFHGSLDYQVLFTEETPESLQMWMFLSFFLSFAMKIPKMPLHMWLPQAHVEAPMAGSVLLAGVLLKLGGYGFMSFSWTLFPYGTEYFSPVVMLLALVATVYASLSTCRQIDTKKLMAYSSIAHMSLVTLGMFSKTHEGVVASIMLMMAHGFVSSGLFIMVTNLYSSFYTSTMKYYKGLVYTMPLFTTMFFLLMLCNMAFPITMNFVGEFLSMLAITQTTLLGLGMCLLGVVITGIYSLLLMNKISFGFSSSFIFFTSDLTSIELQPPTMLMMLTLMLGLNPSLLNMTLTSPFLQ